MKKNNKRSKFQKIFDVKYFFFDFVKLTGIIPTVLFLRLKRYYISGKKPKAIFNGPFIVVSNHTTMIDPVIIMNTIWNRRVSFVATKELFDSKFGNFFFNSIRCIKIDKDNVSMQTFKSVKNVIERGHIASLFPEGHIESDDNIDNFKSGAVMFAVLCNVPIVQIYIKKREHWYNRQRVVISNKIEVKDLIKSKIPTVDEIAEITKLLEKQEQELKETLIKNKK